MKLISNWTGKIIFALAVGAVFFIGALFVRDGGQWYKAESRIIVLPKDDKTARNLDVVLGNISSIPGTLSFYDDFMGDGEEFESMTEELSSSKKKALWKEMIAVSPIEGTSLIAISNKGSNFMQAKDVNSQIIKQLAISTSRYYDSSKEVEIKVIGDVELTYLRDYRPFGAGLLGIIAGFMIAWVLGIFFKDRKLDQVARVAVHRKFLEDMFEKKGEKEMRDSFEKSVSTKDSKDKAVKADEPAKTEKPKSAVPESSVFSAIQTADKKGAAPANLPTGVAMTEEEDKVEKEDEDDDKPSGSGGMSAEPTDEEVKERLNALIRGEL